MSSGWFRDVAVVVEKHAVVGAALVAMAEPFGERPTKKAVFQFLQGLLPANHLPRQLRFVQEIPRSRGGKLAVSSLALPMESRT
jgi:acyl-CoA synthetase (AMP-forming)/AMP-acid ligase II